MEHKEYRKLHAEWYEIMSAEKDHTKEIDVLERRIGKSGGPVLELGSGTGRVLIPLLERGLDAHGVDTSEDMMERCREKCKAKGLSPRLYEQSMVEFDLPVEFGSVLLVSGSLGLFVSDQDIGSMFERVMRHLKPGGLFIYEFEQVRSDTAGMNDGTWSGDWRKVPGNAVIAWRSRNRYDAATHVWERLFVLEKFVDGRLVETEANERTGRFFSVEQAAGFAESAGFVNIRATNWLSDDPPSKDSNVVTIRCEKP